MEMHNLPTLLAATIPLLILAFFKKWAVVAGIAGLMLGITPIFTVLAMAGEGMSSSGNSLVPVLFFGIVIMAVSLYVFAYTRRRVSHGWALVGAIAWTASGIIVFGI